MNAAATPPATALLRVRPNPTRGATSFTLDLARGGRVGLDIFDSSGRSVRRLSRGVLVAGHHRLEWDGRDASGRRVAAGVYFARIAAGAHRETHKLTVVR